MVDPSDLSELERRRKHRISIAIAVGLVALVVLFYLLTIFRLGSNVVNVNGKQQAPAAGQQTTVGQ